MDKSLIPINHLDSLQCLGCGHAYPVTKLLNLCPQCSRPLQWRLDLRKLKTSVEANSCLLPQRKDMWRYGELMWPFADNGESQTTLPESHGEGFTPLIDCSNWPLAKEKGFSLKVKDEGEPQQNFGSNPTRSFKDRGMAMVANMAQYFGIDKLVVPTQGNAGDSLAWYASKMGLQCVVIMPEDTPQPIQQNVRELSEQFADIEYRLVKGTIKEAGDLMREEYLRRGYFNVATFQEPGWRIEGKKSLGLEIADPVFNQGQWQLPDVIIYPTGGGTGILGMWKAFNELEALGLIDARRPRMICVQSEQTCPLVCAFDEGKIDTEMQQAGHTQAVGLNVPGGVGHFKVLDIIRKSNGAALSVSETEIEQVLLDKALTNWIELCPEGAATLACICKASARNLIGAGDKVVAVNTGSPKKYNAD